MSEQSGIYSGKEGSAEIGTTSAKDLNDIVSSELCGWLLASDCEDTSDLAIEVSWLAGS